MRSAHPNLAVNTPQHLASPLVCSLAHNELEAEGAKHVADALTANSTLTELKYAHSQPSLACCQYPLTSCLDPHWKPRVQ